MDINDFPFDIMDVVSLLRLNIRRRIPSGVYTDCPFCGRRGKLCVKSDRNVWRCNYCDAKGGMLALYGMAHHINNSEAYWEICEALCSGGSSSSQQAGSPPPRERTAVSRGSRTAASSASSAEGAPLPIQPASSTDAQAVHKTLSTLLDMLSLSNYHQELLRKQGVAQEQIVQRRSTPPPYRCRSIVDQLVKRGYTLQGVPGFYQDDDGKWAINLHKWNAGILTPIFGGDGLVHDLQIQLNKPIRLVCSFPESEATTQVLLSTAPTVTEVVVQQSERADDQTVHQTFSTLLGMLSLTPAHRKNLRERGLTDEQIDRLGYKSTPPPYLCRAYTDRVLKQGCKVQGVPGFYLDDEGRWTVRFLKRLAGLLVPCRGIDGLIKGAQIRLDVPIKDKDADPDKEGAKYLWLSSSMEYMGAGSGSPVHFAGDPFARVVYVTEGLLKADVAHCLMNRTFASTAGANNTDPFDGLFALLKQTGTRLIVEALDMDKYRNQMIANGASKLYLLAQEHGLDWQPLTWNPNYKGVDDWQLALKKKAEKKKEVSKLNFKNRYLAGECGVDGIEACVDRWYALTGDRPALPDYLGLTGEEMTAFIQGSAELEKLLRPLRREQSFRIYQLDFGSDKKPKPFAFLGIAALRKAGYEQPPAAEYRLAYDGVLYCGKDTEDKAVLERIFSRFNDDLPGDYHGRSVSPSDVVELYDGDGRRYFYCDGGGFVPVKFSPALALPMQQPA